MQHESTGNPHGTVERRIELADGGSAVLLLDPDSSDPIVRAYLNGDPLNRYMADVLAELVDGASPVIDLGSHVGTFSLAAAASGRTVVAVDANRSQVELLRAAAGRNGFENLSIVWAAISATPGSVRFAEDGLFGHIDFGGDNADAVEVPAITLDAVFDLVPPEAGVVGFLKMDIEGAEYDALITGESSIRNHLPVILYESNGMTLESAGRSVDDLRTLFELWDYRVFRQVGDRWLYAPPGQIQPEAWVDMIAVHTSKLDDLSDRIDWEWSDAGKLALCEAWAALPHENTKAYLAAAIRQREANSPELVRIAEAIEESQREARGNPSPAG